MCQGHTNFQKPRRSIQPIELPSCIVAQCHWQGIRCPTSQFLLEYLLRNHLISDHQFGFLPGRSTTLQLVSLVHEWQRALDSGYPTVAVFMDFMKAFDRVWHAGLLHKLAAAGLTKPSIAWLTSYLSTRTIAVTVGSTQSKEHSITAGVPQGSHLGPVLFLVFINDMPDKLSTTTTSQTKTDLYADDALLHTTCSPSLPIQSQLQVLQNAVDTAEDWALSWGGRFGHSKTVQLALGRRMDSVCQDNPLFIEGRQINLAATHKHLGVILSNTLRWSAHITGVILKGEVRTINDGNICERRRCMKNNGKSPTFKFVSGEERRPSEVQRVSRGWRLPGATHSSADLTWIRKRLEIQAPELSELVSVEPELGSCCSDLDKQVSDEICRTPKRQFEIPFRL